MQSLYGFVAILSGRVTHLLGLQDFSLDSHTAQFLAGNYKQYFIEGIYAGFQDSIWNALSKNRGLSFLDCAGVIKTHLDPIGAKKVVCLVTDNAANIKAARQLVISDSKYSHIISIRSALYNQAISQGIVIMVMW